MGKVVEDLKFALILKFYAWRPPTDVIWQQISKCCSFLEVLMIRLMDRHSVLLHLILERDYIHAWAWEGCVVVGCAFRLFNWLIDFDVQKE